MGRLALVLAIAGRAAALEAPPPPVPTPDDGGDRNEPPAPMIRPEIWGSATRDEERPGGGVRDDLLGDRAVGEIEVRFRPDGSARVDVPRSLHMRMAICGPGICIGTRGVKRRLNKPIELATAPVIFGIGGIFGWLPHSPRDATRLVERTRAQRIRPAIDTQRCRLERASGAISGPLADLLHDRKLGDACRPAIMFALWNHAACTATPAQIDEPLATERAAAAADARSRIETFGRRFIPHDAALGYSDRELTTLNAKRCSRDPFAPYAAPE